MTTDSSSAHVWSQAQLTGLWDRLRQCRRMVGTFKDPFRPGRNLLVLIFCTADQHDLSIKEFDGNLDGNRYSDVYRRYMIATTGQWTDWQRQGRAPCSPAADATSRPA